MRIHGRVLRPATLAERRLLLSLGHPFVRIPRRANPFIVARRLRRAALLAEDLGGLRSLLAGGA